MDSIDSERKPLLVDSEKEVGAFYPRFLPCIFLALFFSILDLLLFDVENKDFCVSVCVLIDCVETQLKPSNRIERE